MKQQDLPFNTPAERVAVDDLVVISAYTREAALEDGALIDARTGDFAEVTQQHHPAGIPIYITASLLAVMDAAIARYSWQSYKGIWHDVLSMCRVYVNTIQAGETRPFPVIIGASSSTPRRVFVALDGEALTFMLKEDL